MTPVFRFYNALRCHIFDNRICAEEEPWMSVTFSEVSDDAATIKLTTTLFIDLNRFAYDAPYCGVVTVDKRLRLLY